MESIEKLGERLGAMEQPCPHDGAAAALVAHSSL
jgi:hypothetical protein